jgi:WD40 repeat protein
VHSAAVTGNEYALSLCDEGASDTILHMSVSFQLSRMVPGAHAGRIISCAWSPLHDRVVSLGQDDVIRVWDGLTGMLLHVKKKPIFGGHIFWSRPYQYELAACAWSPCEDRFICAVKFLPYAYDNQSTGAHVLVVHDGRGRRTRKEMKGHTGHVRCCAWSPDGGRIVSAGSDHFAILWDARTGKCLYQYADGFLDAVACAWDPEGRRIAQVSLGGEWRIWDGESGATLSRGVIGRELNACAWSNDGVYLLVSGDDGLLFVLDPARGSVLRSKKVHDDAVSGCAWLPGGKVLSISASGSIRIDDLQADENEVLLRGDSGFAAMAISPAGAHGVAGNCRGDLFFLRRTGS